MVSRNAISRYGRLVVSSFYAFRSPGLMHVDPEDPYMPLESVTQLITKTNIPQRPPALALMPLLHF